MQRGGPFLDSLIPFLCYLKTALARFILYYKPKKGKLSRTNPEGITGVYWVIPKSVKTCQNIEYTLKHYS